ncbi:MAG: hypothetical protein ABUJ98_12810 [Hyphomicrobium sp.]|jgi:hypothetical protein
MIETLSVTQILAVFIGLYMVAAGIGFLTGRGSYASLIDELRDNTALGYVTGAFVFALGAAMVAVHNLWTGPLAIVVSLVGWGALIEGVLMLAIRRTFLGLVKVVPLTPATLVPCGIAAIVFGAVLAIAGLC